MKIRRNYQDIAIWTIFLALFVYIILRAYFLSFVHDESLSYSILTGDPTSIDTANNHILNTCLMDWCYGLFGESEFSLRLPNILAFGLYLFSCFTIFKQFNNKWIFLLGTSILILNPFLIDFFSLARGYGLSLGFMMMSLMFLLKTCSSNLDFKPFIISITLSLFFSSLAVFSNLGMINYHIAILGIYLLQYFLFLKQSPQTTIKQKIIIISILLIAIDPVYEGIERLLLLNKHHQLYYGEDSLVATIDSLIINSLYFSENTIWVIAFIKYAIIIFLLAGVTITILKKDFRQKISLIVLLNSLIIIGLVLEHYLFDSKYPSGRTALFFIPIFGLLICYLILYLFQQYSRKNLFWIIVVLLISTPLTFHFFESINLKYTKTWQYDAHTKDVMKIVKTHTDSLNYKSSIRNNYLFEPTINYYINSRKIKLYTNNKETQSLNSMFIYELDYKENPMSFNVLSSYTDINSVLLIKK